MFVEDGIIKLNPSFGYYSYYELWRRLCNRESLKRQEELSFGLVILATECCEFTEDELYLMNEYFSRKKLSPEQKSEICEHLGITPAQLSYCARCVSTKVFKMYDKLEFSGQYFLDVTEAAFQDYVAKGTSLALVPLVYLPLSITGAEHALLPDMPLAEYFSAYFQATELFNKVGDVIKAVHNRVLQWLSNMGLSQDYMKSLLNKTVLPYSLNTCCIAFLPLHCEIVKRLYHHGFHVVNQIIRELSVVSTAATPYNLIAERIFTTSYSSNWRDVQALWGCISKILDSAGLILLRDYSNCWHVVNKNT